MANINDWETYRKTLDEILKQAKTLSQNKDNKNSNLLTDKQKTWSEILQKYGLKT